MPLSNTAVPFYYGHFRDAVVNGEIPVCKEISMQMNLIDQRIANPAYYYDPAPVEGFIAFCEGEMTLTDGANVHLLPSFKLWAEDLFGWYYFVEKTVYQPNKNGRGGNYVRKKIKKRLINKQFLIVGRGAAKSLYDAFIHEYFHVVDTSTTHQITTAPTMKQADEVLSPIRTAITRSRGPMFKFLTMGSLQNTSKTSLNHPKLKSSKRGIENDMSNSLIEIRPMSIDKLQGLRVKVSTVDEWLSVDIREDPIGAIEQGASKIDDYIIVASSSEGTIRNGVGDSVKMELMDILKGEYIAPHVSIWWYKLDDVNEVAYPELWVKANPNIGLSVSYEAYQNDVERAEKVPAARNDILAKRFGLPMEGYTYFFTYEETQRQKTGRYFNGLPCALGADLSRGDDFCAFTFIFPINGGEKGFGVKSYCYISEMTQKKLPIAMREKYNEFINEGSLMVFPGTVLEMEDVYTDLCRIIETYQYDVRAFGYDPYNAAKFVELWIGDNGSYCTEKVIQGFKTESVPLGELKNLAEERMLIFDQSIMEFCMGNAVAKVDVNGNRMLTKRRNDQKIDSVAAMMDAYVAFKDFRDEFE